MTGGKKQLRLVRKVEDAKSRENHFDPSYSTDVENSTVIRVAAAEEDDPQIRYGDRTARRLSIQHPIEGLISVSPSMDQFTETDQSRDEIDPNFLVPDVVEVDGRNIEDLLASPIELDKVRLERVRMADGTKRGSGLVMAEELDDLERSESRNVTRSEAC